MEIQENSPILKPLPTQQLAHLINANVCYVLCQRGSGKTTYVIGYRLQHLNVTMPRCQVLLFSDSYVRLEDRIVPNIKHFWETKLKWVEGVDFVMYKKPPDSFTKPLMPLQKYDKVISTSDGMAICLVSLSVEGSANAFNAQAGIGDEVKYCNEEKIDSEVLPAIGRGAEEYYQHLPEYGSIWMVTDKYGPVKWILKKKKLVNQPAVDIVYTLQMQIFEWEQQMQQYSSTETIYKFKNKIEAYEQKLQRLRKNLIYYADMLPYENSEIRDEFFFKRARLISKSEYVYNVAYLNHDPDKVEHTFYPTFTKNNKYKSRHDYDTTLPIVGAMDYNYAISPLPIVQINRIPNGIFETLNFIDYMYELYPLGMEDVLKAFCKKYERHENKEFHYVFDHTAIGKFTRKSNDHDLFIETLEENGWDVVEHYIGKIPLHETRFENFKRWLAKSGLHATRVNEYTCDQLIKSIEQSPAKLVSGFTEKDKGTERKLNTTPAEDSTHGSDAFDQIVWWAYEFDGISAMTKETDMMKS